MLTLTLNQRLPPSLSIPFIAVAEHLEIPPVATYAALNLWNFQVNQPGADLTNPDNLTSSCSFTGTDDESWFFVVSNAMEVRAAPLLKTMLGAMEAAIEEEADAVIKSLQYLASSLEDIGRLLERMDERCNPQVFYHDIRPMLAGSKNMESSGLPNGVFFDQGDGTGEWRHYRGGSNGQSSLIQFFDVVLGVDHGKSSFHKVKSSSRMTGFAADCVQEMREYMPGPHARFLYDLEEVANIRSFVAARSDDDALTAAYNEAVRSLTAFRNKHIQLVSRYIILPSRQSPVGKSTKRSNIATACREASLHSKTSQGLVGTGGTQLIPFLKGSRDETTASMIK